MLFNTQTLSPVILGYLLLVIALDVVPHAAKDFCFIATLMQIQDKVKVLYIAWDKALANLGEDRAVDGKADANLTNTSVRRSQGGGGSSVLSSDHLEDDYINTRMIL